MLTVKGGHPCLSILPDLFGKKATDIFVGKVNEWNKENNKILSGVK